jgi:hypothetical protein
VRRPAWFERAASRGGGRWGYPDVPLEPPMFGQFGIVAGVFVAGVLVADGVDVDTVRLADVADEFPAACAIAKPPMPDPTSRPPHSRAVAAILRRPVDRRAGSSGEVPTTFEQMGANAIAFSRALGLNKADVLGFCRRRSDRVGLVGARLAGCEVGRHHRRIETGRPFSMA